VKGGGWRGSLGGGGGMGPDRTGGEVGRTGEMMGRYKGGGKARGARRHLV
jgi:hypothetical protein